MGAVLALYLASVFPLNGCIVGGTVLKFRSQLSVNYLVPIIHRIVKTSNKPIKYSSDTKFYGYTAYPLSALNEFRKLTKKKIKGVCYSKNNPRLRYKTKIFETSKIPRVPINSDTTIFKFLIKTLTIYEDIKFKS